MQLVIKNGNSDLFKFQFFITQLPMVEKYLSEFITPQSMKIFRSFSKKF